MDASLLLAKGRRSFPERSGEIVRKVRVGRVDGRMLDVDHEINRTPLEAKLVAAQTIDFSTPAFQAVSNVRLSDLPCCGDPDPADSAFIGHRKYDNMATELFAATRIDPGVIRPFGDPFRLGEGRARGGIALHDNDVNR